MAVTSQTYSISDFRAYADTQDAFTPGVVDAVYSHSPTLGIILGRDRGEFGGVQLRGRGSKDQEGGVSVLIHVNLGAHAGAKRGASAWDTHNVDPDDNTRRAQANWRFYTHGLAISNHDLRQNRGIPAMSSFLERQTRLVTLAKAQIMAEDIHSTASPTNAMTSLDSLIGANDTLQLLSGSTYDNWNSRGLSARGTAAASISFGSGSFAAQGLPDFRTAFHNASEGMQQPDVIITDYATHERYEGSLQPLERFQGAVNVADGSFQALAFKGKPVLADPDCASGAAYFISLDSDDGVYFKTLSGANFEWDPEGFKRSSNQTVMVRVLETTGQLCIGNRRRSNKLTGITD